MKNFVSAVPDHFTPRFSNNLTKLIHEYVTVDELKLYRKRRPPNIEDGNYLLIKQSKLKAKKKFLFFF